MESFIKKSEKTNSLTKEEIVALLSTNEYDGLIFQAADRVREKFVGNDVHLRGLIEFSNVCSQNCLYCGLRRDNKNIERYTLEPEQIIELAKNSRDCGFKTVVLQSGESARYSLDTMVRIISEIKKLGLALTLSIGEKTEEEYKAYKKAGADRYLVRIETTDKALYEKMHPDMKWENRILCIENLRESGFEVGTGCLVGLPEQTAESLADDILFFKKTNSDMVGIGAFIPNPDTPLKNCAEGDFELTAKVMALTRILLPDANIPATTAMETLRPNGRMLLLKRGANVVMPNVTQANYKKKYLLYPGKTGLNDTAPQTVSAISEQIKQSGRTVSTGYGFRKDKKA